MTVPAASGAGFRWRGGGDGADRPGAQGADARASAAHRAARCHCACSRDSGLPQAARAAAASIDPRKIRAHVRFLSLDLLEGRGPGTRGAELAAEYIATQFALAGVEPAGDNGTYFQRVPLFAVHTIEDKTKFSFVPAKGQPVDLAYGGDRLQGSDRPGDGRLRRAHRLCRLRHPCARVPLGRLRRPGRQGIDLKGKIALVIVNEPPSDDEKFFKGKALTYYGRWTYKYEEAARRGAVGVLIIHRTDLASYGWEVVRNSQAVEKSYLQGDPDATLRAAAWIQHDVAQRLFTLAGLGDLDQAIDRPASRARSMPLSFRSRLHAHIESRVRRYVSSNVVGRVAGAARRTRPCFYTAHYDHLGIDPDAKGDNIYNGAADNGTGCGILLELARAFAQSPVRPPHAVYFAAVTAEEQGLLGSQYLGMHPPVPAGQIALDLNYDMLLPIGVPRSVSLGGAERIDFWPTVQTVAKAFDLALLPDPTPMAGHYYRSDHFSLARVGIPAFSVDQGELFEGHDEWGHAQAETTWRTTTTSPPTSTAPTGTSAAMPSWRDSALCWAGWPASRPSRSSGSPATSLNSEWSVVIGSRRMARSAGI
jgi:Zn-dependent M28 family amino/carboxypeptidase